MPSERIQLLVDVVTGNSKSTLGKLKTDLAAADTAAGKLKVTGSAVGDFFKKNLAVGAAAASSAIATFAVKAVSDFQKVALQAGELRDSTGLAAEEASRLAEVAKDIGVPVEAVATSLNRMNRAAAETPGAFDAIGASIARNDDGTTNVNETFLNTIDALKRIPDATKRAAAAQEIFGRGWQQISELVGMGAEELKAALEGVEDAKVIDDEEIAKARGLRDALDELRGVAEAASLAIGEALVPALKDSVATLKDLQGPLAALKEGYDKVTGAPIIKQIYDNIAPWRQLGTRIGQVRDVVRHFGPDIKGTADLMTAGAEATEDLGHGAEFASRRLDDLKDTTDDAGLSQEQAAQRAELLGAALETEEAAARAAAEAMQAAAEASREQADAFRSAADATYAQRDAHRDAAEAAANVQEVIDDEESTMQDLAKALDDAAVAAGIAADADVLVAKERKAAKGETVSATRELGLFNRSLIDQAAQASGPTRAAIVDYIATVNGIPPEKASEILALIDEGKLDQAQRKLNKASEAREATITADAETAAAERELEHLARDRTAHINVFSINRTQGGAGTGDDLAPVGGTGSLGGLDSLGGLTAGGGGRSFLSRRQRRAVRSNLGASENLADQAASLRALAEAATDAEEKEKLLDQANDLIERSSNRAARASKILTDRYGAEADALRRRADALRENAAAFAEAQREQAASRGDAVSARLALEDERASAAEVLARAGRAFQVEGADRAAAINDAQQAALSLAEARVERARELAEAAGREFSEVDAAREREKAIAELARGSGPVAAAMKALLRELNFPDQIRRLEAAERREDKNERAATKNEKSADKLDKASARFERIADSAERAFMNLLRAFGKGLLTKEQLDREIEKALAEIARGARGGRR